jgi:molecular chaperone GrpE
MTLWHTSYSILRHFFTPFGLAESLLTMPKQNKEAMSKKDKTKEKEAKNVADMNNDKDTKNQPIEEINATETTTEEVQNACAEEISKEQLNEMNDRYMRLVAEFDNYKKRTLRERIDLIKSAGEDILKEILPVVDDFERAIQNLDKAKDLEAVKAGIGLIYGKFNEFLKQKGVSAIEAVNMEFDTDKHEAITKIQAPTEELKGKVVDVVKKGYVLNDKVIRFAQVVIGE